jgi:hypothetical protein
MTITIIIIVIIIKGDEVILLKERKGLVKLAIKTG